MLISVSAVHNIKTVAHCVAKSFTYLRNSGLSPEKTTCVGHSLGWNWNLCRKEIIITQILIEIPINFAAHTFAAWCRITLISGWRELLLSIPPGLWFVPETRIDWTPATRDPFRWFTQMPAITVKVDALGILIFASTAVEGAKSRQSKYLTW